MGKQEKEYPGWQVNHGLLNRKEPLGSKPENTVVVKVAVDRVGIFVSLSCVVSVSVFLLAPVKFLVSERQVGKFLILPCGGITSVSTLKGVSSRYTERQFMHQTHLTEPQGIIKKQNKENFSCQ